MKWILSHATDGIHQWQLQQDDGSKLLIFHLQRLSLRLSGISKRVFFLDVQGFLHKKIYLRSEYGIEMGETAFADLPQDGHLTLNEQKYFYSIEDRQMVLLDGEKNTVATTELPVDLQPEVHELFGLLFGLAWFVTADGVTEKDRELSVTA